MKVKGRSFAMATVAGALAVLAAAAIVLRVPLLEEWHLYRLRAGDEEARIAALSWLGENGGEKSLVAFQERTIDLFPEHLLRKRNSCLVIEAELEPKALHRSREDAYSRLTEFSKSLSAVSGNARIFLQPPFLQRLGSDSYRGVFRDVLEGRRGNARLRLCTARDAIVPSISSTFRVVPDSKPLALRRLIEALDDPDPFVRGGAVYGLAEAGSRAPEFLAALSTLRSDPDELVREAAEYALLTLDGARAASKRK